jgi:hypothetical protein
MHLLCTPYKAGRPSSATQAAVSLDLYHDTNRSLLAGARHRLLVHGTLIKMQCIFTMLQPRDTMQYCTSNNSTAFDFLSDMDMQVRRQTDRCKIWSKATPSSPGGMPFSSLKPPLRGSGPAPPVHPSRAAATAAAAFSSAFLFLFSSCHSKVRLRC